MTFLSRARVSSWLLSLALPADEVQHVVGDLEEELASSRPHRGSRWYWSQLARSYPRLLWLPIRRSGWLATFGVACTACVIQAGIELIVGFTVYQLSPAAAWWPAAIGLAVTLASLLTVSRLAARIRPGSATAVAVIAGCVLLGRVLHAAVAGQQVPLGTLAALVVVPALAFTGGALACKFGRA
jgi:hypothetical protein